jgi:DNA (cytosine-5)-methyltransferase 1
MARGRQQRYAAVSLFAGCGGMDLGAERSETAKVVWAVDSDPWAVQTYRRNLGKQIVEGDVTTMPVPEVPCDVLLAGPPCQDYSTLWNHDGLKTARGNLFREVARFLDALRPAGFILENVPGLLSANKGAAWTLVRHALRSPSSFVLHDQREVATPVRYDLTAQVVDLADLGVPQHRDRLIVVGCVAISASGHRQSRAPSQAILARCGKRSTSTRLSLERRTTNLAWIPRPWSSG